MEKFQEHGNERKGVEVKKKFILALEICTSSSCNPMGKCFIFHNMIDYPQIQYKPTFPIQAPLILDQLY